MSWIQLLSLVISVGRSLQSYIAPKFDTLGAELAAEISAALDKLQEVHDKAVTLQELEDLRTTKQW